MAQATADAPFQDELLGDVREPLRRRVEGARWPVWASILLHALAAAWFAPSVIGRAPPPRPEPIAVRVAFELPGREVVAALPATVAPDRAAATAAAATPADAAPADADGLERPAATADIDRLAGLPLPDEATAARAETAVDAATATARAAVSGVRPALPPADAATTTPESAHNAPNRDAILAEAEAAAVADAADRTAVAAADAQATPARDAVSPDGAPGSTAALAGTAARAAAADASVAAATAPAASAPAETAAAAGGGPDGASPPPGSVQARAVEAPPDIAPPPLPPRRPPSLVALAYPPAYSLNRRIGGGEVAPQARLPSAPGFDDATPGLALGARGVGADAVGRPVPSNGRAGPAEDRATGQSGGGVTPASPNAPGLNNPPLAYPEAAVGLGLEGTAVVRVEVDADGRVERVDVARSSGHYLLDEAARRAVENWRFRPATRGGQAVASVVTLPVRFRLPG